MFEKKRAVFLAVIVFSVVVCVICSRTYAGYNENSQWTGEAFDVDKGLSNVSFGNKDTLNDKKFGSTVDGFLSRDVDEAGKFHKTRSLTTKKFIQQIRSDNKKFLKKKLDDRGELSESEKRYLVKYFDKYHAGRAELSDGEDSKSVAVFLKIAHDDSKDLRAKKYALERYFEENK